MENNKEIILRAILISLLVLVAECAIIFQEKIVSFFSVVPSIVIYIFSFGIAGIVGWLFYLENVKSNKLKNQFIEIVTHNFRTPISVIGWSADALETGIEMEKRREEVKKIRISLEKLRLIIDTLLGVIESEQTIFYHFDPVGFRDIIEDSLKENIRNDMSKKGIKLNVDMPVKLPTLYVDRKRIGFVVKNLIENAVTYTPTGGEITLFTREKPGSLVFGVKDTGIGINKEDKFKIFNNFFRSRDAKLSDPDGLGLGLFVSKRIIEKHKGRIWAESEGSGKGATFLVEFKIDEYGQVV